MAAAPPPLGMYVVLGQDGQRYTVSLEKLRELATDRRVTSAHMVYSYSSNRWSHAGQLPELLHLFPHASTSAAPSKSNFARVAIPVIALVALLGIVTAASRCGDTRSP